MSRALVGLAALAMVLAIVPAAAPSTYVMALFNIIGLYAIVTMGLVLLGTSGQVSLGHAAFYGLGAYTSALLARDLGWSPWLAMPCAVALVAATAYVVGLPAMRLADVFFVMNKVRQAAITKEIIEIVSGAAYGA